MPAPHRSLMHFSMWRTMSTCATTPPLGLALPARRRGNLRVDAALIAQRDVRDAQSPKPVHQLAGEVELLGRAGEAAAALRVARRADGDIPE